MHSDSLILVKWFASSTAISNPFLWLLVCKYISMCIGSISFKTKYWCSLWFIPYLRFNGSPLLRWCLELWQEVSALLDDLAYWICLLQHWIYTVHSDSYLIFELFPSSAAITDSFLECKFFSFLDMFPSTLNMQCAFWFFSYLWMIRMVYGFICLFCRL